MRRLLFETELGDRLLARFERFTGHALVRQQGRRGTVWRLVPLEALAGRRIRLRPGGRAIRLRPGGSARDGPP